MFLTIKKRFLLIILCCVIFITGFSLYFLHLEEVNSPNTAMSIIIDAGHGGKDGGAVGSTGVSESYLNLQYAKELQTLCEDAGFKVIMTRSDMNGLYSPLASNKKRSEMEKREKIINSADGKLVVSIHMNSYPLSSLYGAQVFYKKDNESGKNFAQSVQSNLKKESLNTRGEASVGDYYVLNCTDKPAILVECGFLSNVEEELKLCSDEYRKNFCESLFRGVLDFYSL